MEKAENGPMTENTNLLVLLLGDTKPARLHDAIAARSERPARIHVVASPIVGPLDWLATSEDSSRRGAKARILETEWTLADQANVDGEAGDVDPVQAVEDALRGFPADEILIAGNAADGDLDEALRRFGLPIGRVDPPPANHSSFYRGLRGLAGGHNSATPLILFFGVNTVLVLFALLFSLLIVLALWLSGTL